MLEQEKLRAPEWWRNAALRDRFVCDLLDAELRLLRRSGAGLPPPPWPASFALEDDLGIDSLERNALMFALADSLDPERRGGHERLLAATTLAQLYAALSFDDVGLGFKTSGSSGVPKRCIHPLAELWQEACFFSTLLANTRRILYAVPAHHIYGFLFTVLLPLACAAEGGSVIELIDVRHLPPGELVRQAAEGDVIVGHPHFWAPVARWQGGWPAGVTGVTSTAPCPEALAVQLADAGLRLLEVYGSSETAGVGWRDDARAPYALLPWWQRAGGEEAALLRTGADGSLRVSRCQDAIAWSDARHIVPAGRADGAVQVGGVNVFPAQVAALLRRHPAVREAQVRLMRADEGQRLKAFIVAADTAHAAALPGQLAAWVRTRLPAAARPVSFTLGAALPTGPQGKPMDWIIADPAGMEELRPPG